MNDATKALLPISAALLLGLTLSCDVAAGQLRDKIRTNRQIETCLAEIARHADYGQASKVVHWVISIDQKNLAELRIVIDTTVLHEDARGRLDYRTSCVTDTRRGVVDFRFDSAVLSTNSNHRRADFQQSDFA